VPWLGRLDRLAEAGVVAGNVAQPSTRIPSSFACSS
jgi:hypothetical protein